MTTAALVTSATAYRSDLRPDMVPFEESLGSIRGFTYKSKSNQSTRWGHRQRYSTIAIRSISAAG